MTETLSPARVHSPPPGADQCDVDDNGDNGDIGSDIHHIVEASVVDGPAAIFAK